ncbi:flavin reductase [Mycolicibacterium phlei]|uniref:Flavin reductase n=1 Tax=Mycolicibacterium phlei DSM 43239 = CCUG 21000 TaxID=1226750 RepID=A0A5N5UYL5_MYCPH|nr:flavin reductase [Mycolicibacterium phlei]KAB7754743.1 flavin reductase [Mycolicibacterium phlei DSM 43239 = CCUG 21000]KXW65388.1 flavin reductase [Mycolicibacterium phlei DSM 43239 = CCUG 21000]
MTAPETRRSHDGDAAAFDSSEFRSIMGHYPTGVTVVTAIDSDGEPVGLTIGSFSSVSLDPPLVAFYPQRESGSFARLRQADVFCINFLADDQEDGCRNFASRSGDKFSGVRWQTSPAGAPILEGAIAWLECSFHAIAEAGDHFIVTGAVRCFEAQRDRMPLLFFRGGYGSFLPRTLALAPSQQLQTLLRYVDIARPLMDKLSDRLETGCLAAAVVDNHIMTLASTSDPQNHLVPAAVGQRVAWRPPLGAMFVAWDRRPEAFENWLRRSSAPLDDAQRGHYEAALQRVRERGWSIALATEEQKAFENSLPNPVSGSFAASAGPDDLIPKLYASYEPVLPDRGTELRVRHIGAPVFDPSGQVVLVLHLFGLPARMTVDEIDAYASITRTIADQVTDSIRPRV